MSKKMMTKNFDPVFEKAAIRKIKDIFLKLF